MASHPRQTPARLCGLMCVYVVIATDKPSSYNACSGTRL